MQPIDKTRQFLVLWHPLGSVVTHDALAGYRMSSRLPLELRAEHCASPLSYLLPIVRIGFLK